MAQAAQPALAAIALAIEPRLRVGGAFVALVRALLAVKVALAVAPRAAIVIAAVPGPERLHRRPRLDQRPVHREVIPAQQTPHLAVFDDAVQELRRNLRLKKAVPVLAEHAGVPHRIVQPQPHEPAEQHIELELFHQLALGTDRIKRLQQQRPQQLLRRDRRPPRRRIERFELTRQRSQNVVHEPPDDPKRMPHRNPRLKVNVAEKVAVPSILTPHPTLHDPTKSANHVSLLNARSFSGAC